MKGLMAVTRKELADHFASKRFLVLFLLVYLAGVFSIYLAGQNIRSIVSEDTKFAFLKLFLVSQGESPFSFLFFMTIFIPIVGIALGFDAINSEKSSGNLSRLLAQPLYRDSLINGKFLSGVVVIGLLVTSIVLIVSGLGIWRIGIMPDSEEAFRLVLFIIVTVLYGAFWMALSMMFSVFFDRAAYSALASILIWIFFLFFWSLIASSITSAVVPFDETSSVDVIIQNAELGDALGRVSPNTLYGEAVQILLLPELGSASQMLTLISVYISGWMPTPLPIGQSLLIVWPQIVALIALCAVCFALGYIKLMREEIRST